MIDRIDRPDDLRLVPYAHVGDPDWLRREGLFVAEGRFVVERVIDAERYRIASIVVTPAAHRALADRLAGVDAPVFICDQEALNGVTGFNFHRGCLALVERPAPRPLTALASARRVVALEGVGNPDNVGGIFRSAAALHADGVIVGPATGDPLYRKSIRTSMGAVLTLPWTIADDWNDTLGQMRAAGCRILALTPRADAAPLEEAKVLRSERLVLLLGSEGSGLSGVALGLADVHVRIPIASGLDSLNVTIAASIALYALRP